MKPLELIGHRLIGGINFHSKTAKPLIPILAALVASKARVVVSYKKVPKAKAAVTKTGVICQPPSSTGRMAFAGGGALTDWMNEQDITEIATEGGEVLFDKKAA